MSFINRLRLTPVLCTAIGAASGYYILIKSPFAVIVCVLIAAVVSHCFFRAAASLKIAPFFWNQFPAHKNIIRNLQLTSVCSGAAAIGLVLGLCAADAGKNDVVFGINSANVTAVEGVLLEDPRITSGGSVAAPVSLIRSSGNNGLRISSSGVINVFFPSESADKLKQYGRGAAVFAEGTLRFSESFGWSLSAKSLHITKSAPSLERMRTDIRLKLISRFNDESWGALALALLLGVRDNLDSGFTEQYRQAGLSYILALSGMHLAILAALIAFVLRKPLGLKASVIVSSVLIILYCLLVGPFPSLNRSAFMYLLGALAVLGALPKNSFSVLSISFLIQIIITPAAGNSLSFILSYTALLGILITSQALSFLLQGKVPAFVLQPLSLSCGAFLATSGICSFTFGMIAPIGIIAGLFIVPLTAVFMTGSIIYLLLDIFSISHILNLPLSLIYKLMEFTASLAGNVPAVSANPVLILIISLALSALIVIFEFRRRRALYQIQPFLY